MTAIPVINCREDEVNSPPSPIDLAALNDYAQTSVITKLRCEFYSGADGQVCELLVEVDGVVYRSWEVSKTRKQAKVLAAGAVLNKLKNARVLKGGTLYGDDEQAKSGAEMTSKLSSKRDGFDFRDTLDRWCRENRRGSARYEHQPLNCGTVCKIELSGNDAVATRSASAFGPDQETAEVLAAAKLFEKLCSQELIGATVDAHSDEARYAAPEVARAPAITAPLAAPANSEPRAGGRAAHGHAEREEKAACPPASVATDEKLMLSNLESIGSGAHMAPHKCISVLNEHCQKHGSVHPPNYQFGFEPGVGFSCTLTMPSDCPSPMWKTCAVGASKKAAKSAAASSMYQKLCDSGLLAVTSTPVVTENEIPNMAIPDPARISAIDHQTRVDGDDEAVDQPGDEDGADDGLPRDCISVINEYCQRHCSAVSPRYDFSVEMGNYACTATMPPSCPLRTSFTSVAPTKKTAKKLAARKMLQGLVSAGLTGVYAEYKAATPSAGSPATAPVASGHDPRDAASTGSTPPTTNGGGRELPRDTKMEGSNASEGGEAEEEMTKGAVCRVHEFCQSAATEPPTLHFSHMTDGRFQCELTLPAAIRVEERTAYGHGSSKKEAKTDAAQKMWDSLSKRSPWPRWEGPHAASSRARREPTPAVSPHHQPWEDAAFSSERWADTSIPGDTALLSLNTGSVWSSRGTLPQHGGPVGCPPGSGLMTSARGPVGLRGPQVHSGAGAVITSSESPVANQIEPLVGPSGLMGLVHNLPRETSIPGKPLVGFAALASDIPRATYRSLTQRRSSGRTPLAQTSDLWKYLMSSSLKASRSDSRLLVRSWISGQWLTAVGIRSFKGSLLEQAIPKFKFEHFRDIVNEMTKRDVVYLEEYGNSERYSLECETGDFRLGPVWQIRAIQSFFEGALGIKEGPRFDLHAMNSGYVCEIWVPSNISPRPIVGEIGVSMQVARYLAIHRLCKLLVQQGYITTALGEPEDTGESQLWSYLHGGVKHLSSMESAFLTTPPQLQARNTGLDDIQSVVATQRELYVYQIVPGDTLRRAATHKGWRMDMYALVLYERPDDDCLSVPEDGGKTVMFELVYAGKTAFDLIQLSAGREFSLKARSVAAGSVLPDLVLRSSQVSVPEYLFLPLKKGCNVDWDAVRRLNEQDLSLERQLADIWLMKEGGPACPEDPERLQWSTVAYLADEKLRVMCTGRLQPARVRPKRCSEYKYLNGVALAGPWTSDLFLHAEVALSVQQVAQKSRTGGYLLRPELCWRLSIEPFALLLIRQIPLWERSIFVHSLKRVIDTSSKSTTADFKDVVTPRSTGDPQNCNFERFEFLGDSLLSLLVSVTMFKRHPDYTDGQLSRARTMIVSNGSLSKRAEIIDLASALTITKSTLELRRWPLSFGSVRESERALTFPKKQLADCLEAMIGLMYSVGGFAEAARLLGLLGVETDMTFDGKVPSEVIEHPNLTLFDVSPVEKSLKYTFKHKALLCQALLHASMGNGVSYQRLEFLGDSLLNFLVCRHFFKLRPDFGPFELTKTCAHAKSNQLFAATAINLGLNLALRHRSPSVTEKCRSFSPAQVAAYSTTYALPKILADVMEAAAAAVFLDSGNSTEVTWSIFGPEILKTMGTIKV